MSVLRILFLALAAAFSGGFGGLIAVILSLFVLK